MTETELPTRPIPEPDDIRALAERLADNYAYPIETPAETAEVRAMLDDLATVVEKWREVLRWVKTNGTDRDLWVIAENTLADGLDAYSPYTGGGVRVAYTDVAWRPAHGNGKVHRRTRRSPQSTLDGVTACGKPARSMRMVSLHEISDDNRCRVCWPELPTTKGAW